MALWHLVASLLFTVPLLAHMQVMTHFKKSWWKVKKKEKFHKMYTFKK